MLEFSILKVLCMSMTSDLIDPRLLHTKIPSELSFLGVLKEGMSLTREESPLFIDKFVSQSICPQIA